jgi:hypothetical protein
MAAETMSEANAPNTLRCLLFLTSLPLVALCAGCGLVDRFAPRVDSEEPGERRKAVHMITYQARLADLCEHCLHDDVRREALAGISDQSRLFEVAAHGTFFDTRKSAIDKLTDQRLLEQISLSCDGRYFRQYALRKLDDQARSLRRWLPTTTT